MIKPTPINEEIVLNPKKYIISQTDKKGIITFCNEYFIEISQYTKKELIGSAHNIIRHPDMPKIIFKLLWDRIKQGKNINIVVKNLSKDGRYYWIFTEFENKKDENTGDIVGYTASRRTISKHVVEIISKLYSELLEIEKTQSIDASEKYLNEFLNSTNENIEFSNLMEEIHKFY